MSNINLLNNGDTGLQARTIINDLVNTVNSISGSGFPYTGSAIVSGSIVVTGSTISDIFIHPQEITSNLILPAEYNGFLVEPLDIIGNIDIGVSSSLTIFPSEIIIPDIDTGSLATTGSNTFIGNQYITGSVNITGSLTVNTVNVGANTINFVDENGGVLTSLSYSGSGLVLSTGSIDTTASNAISSSYSNNAESASYTLTSSYSNNTTTAISSSYALSSSFVLTASYALNGGGSVNTSSLATTGSNTFIGNQIITGSLIVKSGSTHVWAPIDTIDGLLNTPDSYGYNTGSAINWYSRVLYSPQTSPINYVLDWGNGVMGDGTNDSLNWFYRAAYDINEVVSIDWNIRSLYNSSGPISMDWENRLLQDASSAYSVDWGNRSLYDSGFPFSVAALNWASRQLYDTTGTVTSADWGNRYLYDAAGIPVLSVDWGNRTLNDNLGNTVLNWFDSSSATFSGTATYAQTASYAQVLTLEAYDPLPSSPAGTIAVSASTPPKPYFYDGSTWNALY